MAYWEGKFRSKNNHLYTCRIYDRTLTENKTFDFGTGAAVLSYERGDNKYMPYKAIMCTMDIVTSEDMSSIYSDVPMHTPVTIIDESSVIWFDGYLIPSEWRNDARPGLKKITINATDALGMLKYNKLTNAYRQNATLSSLWSSVMESMNIDEENQVSSIGDAGTVSTEIFLPKDHTEPLYNGAWGTYEDVINAIGIYTNYTTMIWKGVAYCVDIDTFADDYWQSSVDERAEDNIQSNDINVEILPSYSHLMFHPKGGRKIVINNIFDGIDINQCKASSTTTSKNQEETQHCQLSVISQTSPSSASRDFDIVSQTSQESNLVLLRTWSDGAEPGGDPIPLLTGSINLKPAARHTMFTGQFCYIKCSVMIGDYKPWVESYLESTAQSEDENPVVTGSHIGLKVAGITILPNYVQNIRPAGAKGFFEVIYRFSDLPGGLVEPVIIQQSTPIYIRSIEVISLSENEYGAFDNNYQEIVTLNNGFDRNMNIEMPIMVGRNYEVSAEYLAYVRSGNAETFEKKIHALSEQYRHPRRLYSAALPLAGFNPFYKVNFGNRKCTIDGARIILRDDIAEAEFLESGL